MRGEEHPPTDRNEAGTAAALVRPRFVEHDHRGAVRAVSDALHAGVPVIAVGIWLAVVGPILLDRTEPRRQKNLLFSYLSRQSVCNQTHPQLNLILD